MYASQEAGSGLEKSSAKHQTWRNLAVDLGAASVAAALIAPPVAVIDRAVVETVVKQQSLLQGLRAHATTLRRPVRCLLSRPGGIIWALYATTYATANASETISKSVYPTGVGTATLVSTMLVNVPMGAWKDIRFAQLYGTSVESVVKSTTSLRLRVSTKATAAFLIRDGLTLFGSFILAPTMSDWVPDALVSNAHTKALISQMVFPVLTQLVVTPLHLMGIDLQNRQAKFGISNRWAHIQPSLPIATLIRCIRIVPAFSIGCIVNMEMRAFYQSGTGTI